MSEKEYTRRKIAKEVMRSAWVMFRRCMISWRTCLRITWRTVRFRAFIRYTKVRGTTFGNRQAIIRKLSSFPSADIELILLREPDNPYDSNAVIVVAVVRNMGMSEVGYLSCEISSWISPYIDSGGEVVAMISEVTGIDRNGAFLGMNLKYVLL